MTARQQDPKRHCNHCGPRLRRKRFGTKLEGLGVFSRRKYCDRVCMAASMHRQEVTKGTHLWRARKHRKPNCEKCGSSERLHVHHRDENWRNNDPKNLQTLCPACHLKLHWEKAEHAPKRRWVLAKGLDGLLGLCARIEARLPPADAAEMRDHISNLWSKLPATGADELVRLMEGSAADGQLDL
jgi:hypothetical protein